MPERSGNSHPDVVAVIDIGSNSGRVMVFEREVSNHLRLLAGSRASLRLVHDVDARGALSDATMARTTERCGIFRRSRPAPERSASSRWPPPRCATRPTARCSLNGWNASWDSNRDYRRRAEARYGFAGAVRGLAVSTGLLFDLGGGSLQISRFARAGWRKA